MSTAPQLVPPDHPALWTRAAELTRQDRENHQHTIGLMREAVAKVGAAGLAAPQLGLSLRMFVTKYEAFPVVINPTYRKVGLDHISKPERCLSLNSFTTYVRRPAKIYAEWEDTDGFRKTALLESMDARVFLHLYDLVEGRPIFPRPLRVSHSQAVNSE